MFAIGEAKGKVIMSKLELPSEYGLRKKDRKIYGAWVGDTLLYLSDEVNSLRLKVGKDGIIFEPTIDAMNRITVSSSLNDMNAMIRGRITTIKIEFSK